MWQRCELAHKHLQLLLSNQRVVPSKHACRGCQTVHRSTYTLILHSVPIGELSHGRVDGARQRKSSPACIGFGVRYSIRQRYHGDSKGLSNKARPSSKHRPSNPEHEALDPALPSSYAPAARKAAQPWFAGV